MKKDDRDTSCSALRSDAAPKTGKEKICHNPKCGFGTFDPGAKCPKCPGPMWTTREFRLISLVPVFCGLLLGMLGADLG